MPKGIAKSDTIKGVVEDIEIQKKIKNNLEEEIKRLQIIQNNLEAQAHTSQIKDEAENKQAVAQKMTECAVEERRIESLRINAEGRIDVAEELEKKLNVRTTELDNREQRLSDVEGKINDLNTQRMNFEVYKNTVEKDLIQAKETIAEAQEVFDKIDAEKLMMSGREAAVKIQEKIWNDEIGKLEADKKAFQLEKENILGLNKSKAKEK